jgi:hypothetical protein
MKRLLVVLGCMALASSVAAGAHAARSVTFHLVEKQVGFNFVDNPPRQGFQSAPLLGDQFAFTSELVTRAGKHAGHLGAVCTITRGGDAGIATCTGTFFLKGGQIALIAGIKLSGDRSSISIVGGTGVYEGASGSILSVQHGPNGEVSDDTVHLILP